MKTHQNESGMAEFTRMLTLAHTTPETLRTAHLELEKIPETEIQKMMALGIRHLRSRLDDQAAINNLEHVEDQLLKPVMDDANELRHAFGINPTCFRLLVILHDLGKVEIPGALLRFLNGLFPDDYVAREILTHEYASMVWVTSLGQELNLSESAVQALQRLIANHNFGPDLCQSKYKYLRDNWWPSNYRNKIFPKLQELGFDLSQYFHRSEDGVYQYHHAENDVYASLLAVYDRAISNKHNLFGIGTWKKFAQQNYSQWRKDLPFRPNAPSPLTPLALTKNMEDAATWADKEVRAMWDILAERHVRPELKGSFKLESFGPCQRQIVGLQKLLVAIERVKQSNKEVNANSLFYVTNEGARYRVDDLPREPSAQDKAQLLLWIPEKANWQLIAQDFSPINLYFSIIRGDL